LIDDGVVPFHHPWAGRVVSTVSVPELAGVIEMLPFLLVTLQSPKPPPPEADPPLGEEPELHAATLSASATVVVRTRERFSFMDGLVFRGTRE
jgi:hypothetical protein